MAFVERKGSRNMERAGGGWTGYRIWDVVATDGSLAAQDADCPVEGEAFPFYPLVTLKRLAFRALNSANVVVEGYYDDRPMTHMAGTFQTSYEFGTQVEHITYDRDQKPIGMECEGIDIIVPRLVVNQTVWYKEISNTRWNRIHELIGRVNEDEYLRFVPGRLLCTGAPMEQELRELFAIHYTFVDNISDSHWQYEWLPYEVKTGDWSKVEEVWTFVPAADGPKKARVYEPVESAITNRIYEARNFAEAINP